jgi:carbonic anhydrase
MIRRLLSKERSMMGPRLVGERSIVAGEIGRVRSRIHDSSAIRSDLKMGIQRVTSDPVRAPVKGDAEAKNNDHFADGDPSDLSRSRREFLRISGLAVGTAGISLYSTGRAQAIEMPALQAGDRPTPDAVLARLIEGNKRFVKGELTHPGRRPEDFAPLAEGQSPLAIVVGCADSRVSPEVVFDQGVGELFVIRVAGNVVTGSGPFIKGSAEFAVAELGARLIVVLGHSACGAVKGAVAHIDANDTLPGAIRDLVEVIRPAAASVRGKPGDKVENAIKANVEMGVERLKGLDPILAPLVKSGELKVVGAVYELRTGEVKWLD